MCSYCVHAACVPRPSNHRLATGAPRDFAALGRGVPPGKDTTTTLRQASARLVEIGEKGAVGDGGGAVAARIDLLGDRFLRRQVRVLILGLDNAGKTTILKQLQHGNRGDLLVLERFDNAFRAYVEEHGKAPIIVHKDGNLQNCTRANLTWHAPLVKSKYF